MTTLNAKVLIFEFINTPFLNSFTLTPATKFPILFGVKDIIPVWAFIVIDEPTPKGTRVENPGFHATPAYGGGDSGLGITLAILPPSKGSASS
jgi:hypothetical protein